MIKITAANSVTSPSKNILERNAPAGERFAVRTNAGKVIIFARQCGAWSGPAGVENDHGTALSFSETVRMPKIRRGVPHVSDNGETWERGLP